MGMANWPAIQVASVDTLLRAADDALYFAKEKGCNVAAFNESEQVGIRLVVDS